MVSGTLDNIVGGQVLSAVSGGGMTIIVGVVVVAVIMCALAVVSKERQNSSSWPSFTQANDALSVRTTTFSSISAVRQSIGGLHKNELAHKS